MNFGSGGSSLAVSVVYEVRDPRVAGTGLGKEEDMHRVLIQNNKRARIMLQVPSVGFMKSISNSDLHRPSINLNVMWDQAQFKGLIGGLNHIRSEWKQDEAQITKYQSPVKMRQK
ncbi:hypothetical protein LOK49_LG06G01877 [Camellia lanceoleosa]|uniref:Uncharacterized protein n=1 Tax=Camellia lanceoleosa TaxID=1840588 RepID=A0ACC0HE12_9ERIC|nr:hypothetical protein LOK49_LG06G01877 [Camellia lanceoleosa]